MTTPQEQDLLDLGYTHVNLGATEPGEVIYEGHGMRCTVPDPAHPTDEVREWMLTERGAICMRCPEFSIPGYPSQFEDLLDHQVRAHGYVRVYAFEEAP